MYSLQKNGLKEKVLMDIDPRKEDIVIRVQFEKCLLCTFYQKEFYFEFSQRCNKACTTNLTNVRLSMCVMEYSN